jgi:DNA-binding MarR family transcriptional regulator
MADPQAGAGADLARNAAELRVRIARLARRSRREDGGRSLTLSQLSALSRLDRMGAATLSELAAQERVRPQSMARTLDALAGAGLVGREPHPSDRRQHILRLTGTGHAVIDQHRLGKDSWLARAMASVLSPDERALLVRAGALMDRLAEHTDRTGEPTSAAAGVARAAGVGWPGQDRQAPANPG